MGTVISREIEIMQLINLSPEDITMTHEIQVNFTVVIIRLRDLKRFFFENNGVIRKEPKLQNPPLAAFCHFKANWKVIIVRFVTFELTEIEVCFFGKISPLYILFSFAFDGKTLKLIIWAPDQQF